MVPRPLRPPAVFLVALVLASSACSSGEPSPGSAPRAGAGKEASAPLVVDPEAIDVHLVGDWLPNPGPLYDGGGYGRLTEPIVQRFTSDDLTIANLDCPVSTDAPRREGLDFAVRCQRPDLDELVRSGVDVVNLVNDHITDFGAAGIDDTLDALEDKGIAAVGPGIEPITVTTPDGPVDIVAIPRLGPFALTREEAVALVREIARPGVPLVVSVHWGEEQRRAARNQDNLLANELARAGADVVMGHGAGQLHAFRRADGAALFMGLGRFVWPVADSTDPEADTAVASVAIVEGRAATACLLAATISTSGTPAFDHREPSC